MKLPPIKPYKTDFDHSYACGAYAVLELLAARPELARAVYLHPAFRGNEALERLCGQHDIPIQSGEAYFRRINLKENTYVLAEFEKRGLPLCAQEPHVVLANPGDMGNLGTIIRTLAGFNLRDLAILTPAADVWHPKTVRASMGALFRVRFQAFDSFEAYRGRFPRHRLFPFMLDGETELAAQACPGEGLFSLIFGNEATGLAPCFRSLGTSIRIPQSAQVDSLNLAVAVGVGAFLFTSGNKKREGF